MRLARVFPRRTVATPADPLAFVGVGPGFPPLWPAVDAVHVSVTFSWDMPAAERLAREWERVAPVIIGGPATGQRSEEFVPGRYVAPGYVITSRGCPNRCPFCDAWKREGTTRELPITDGWNVLDDNLLACSEAHVRAVFAMLARQKRQWPTTSLDSKGRVQYHRPEFTGGLEAARLRPWHVDLLADLRPAQMFFAYDEPRDYEPLVDAGRLLRAAGFATKHGEPPSAMRCYVLVGREGDTFAAAESRLRATVRAGFIPYAIPYRGAEPVSREWATFAGPWMRPAETRRFVHEEWRQTA